MKAPQPLRLAAVAACALLLSSCVGVGGEIAIRADGSGTMRLVYQVSAAVESLGALEANKPYLPFPIARADFERAVSLAPGLRLERWQRRDGDPERGADRFTIEADIAFSNPAALVAFLDPSGERASYAATGGARTLNLTLSAGREALDPDLAAFVEAAFADFAFDLSLRLPARVSANRGVVDAAGTTVRLTLPMKDIFQSREPLVWTLRW